MERVLILGCSGAGKSTLGLKLSERTGIPVVHMDAYYWQPGWTELDRAEWRRTVAELAAQPRWIMDGNWGSTFDIRMPRADTVILMDFPRWRCLARVAKRTVRYFGRTRPDMGKDCPERVDWDFIKYIWTFAEKKRPQLLDTVRNFDGDRHILRSDRDTAQFLNSV